MFPTIRTILQELEIKFEMQGTPEFIDFLSFQSQQKQASVMTSREKQNKSKQSTELELSSSALEQILIPKTAAAEVQKQEMVKMQQKEISSQRYLSKKNSFFIAVVVAISAINFGYGLSAMSVVDISQIIDTYGIPLSQSETHAVLIGLMPLGAIFGAGFSQIFIKCFNRKHSIYIMLAVLCIGLGIMMIHNWVTIIVGRVIQGVAIGLYVSVGPIFLKQVTPKQLRAQAMTLFGLGKCLGVVIAYSLQNIFIAAGFDTNSYIVLLTFNGYLSIIQAVLFYFFIPQSPMELVQKDQIEKAKQHIALIYKEEYIEDVLAELIEDVQTAKKAVQAEKVLKLQEKEVTEESIRQKQRLRRAYFTGLNVIVTRQFIGANFLITFSGQIIKPFAPTTYIYMSLILNIIQFLGNLASSLFIAQKVGRRPLLLIGVGGMGLASFAIAFSLILNSQAPILVFMVIFMCLSGVSLFAVGWAYPSQVLAAEVAMIPNIIGWVCLTIVTTIPPLIVGVMPANNAYPLFIFFGYYGIVAYILLQIYMKQSRGLSYEQIIASF